MADFGKINSEKAQQIINALKDGRINENEMKELGLTKAEQEALNQAFSSGEVQIGDFVLVNKGRGKNAKGQTVQYTETKPASKQEEAEEKPGFLARAWNRVKRDVSNYGENFTNAWNNSEGFLGTAGALIGATTKTVTDIVKNHAEYVEKGVADITGSETAGKVVSRVVGIGLEADAAKAIEDFGDWSSEKIRGAAKNYDGAERALLESFADFVDDMNAADIALMFAGGAGAVKGFKELPKVLKLLQGVKTSQVAVATVTAATLVGTTSCGEKGGLLGDDVEIKQTVNITVLNNNSTLEQLLDELMKIHGDLEEQKELSKETLAVVKQILLREIANGATLEDIKAMMKDNISLLYAVLNDLINAMTENNKLLTSIKNSISGNAEKIFEVLANIQNSVDVLNNLIANLPGDIKNELSGDLNAILNAIKQGNLSLEQIKGNIEGLAAKLEAILDQVKVNGKTQEEIKKLLEQIRNGQLSDSEKLLAMIDLLKNIEITANDINNKLDVVINQLKGLYQQNKNIQNYLDKIATYIKQNGDKADVTNNLLQKLIKMVQEQGSLTETQLEAILKAISENGDKINVTNQLLADMKTGQEYILNAISKFGVDILNKMDVVVKLINNMTGDNKDIKTALENILKQLVKMDANQQADTKKILEAISKIKVEGSKVDLSSIEAMLAKLIELVGENGKQLSDINAKLDIINITIESAKDEILKHLKAGNATTTAILNALNEFKNISNENDQKILAKMDTIMNLLTHIKPEKYDDSALMAKLDDILNAIKDHEVKVDVTGKVTCECNCGKPHEGILGDLNDLLG